MTDLAREFGISRKTGYKIFERYKEHGLEALSDARASRYLEETGHGAFGRGARASRWFRRIKA